MLIYLFVYVVMSMSVHVYVLDFELGDQNFPLDSGALICCTKAVALKWLLAS